MASYDLEANVTMNAGDAEEEWYRIGMAAYERLKALKHSVIVIPEGLTELVRVRRSGDEGMVVRVLRNVSPRAQATLH